MKWYKHFTDSLSDPFIEELMDNFSHAGYVAWFGLIEIICKENGNKLTGKLEISPIYLKRKLRISPVKLKQIFSFCSTNGKLFFDFSQEKWSFDFPKVAEIKDNYTKDLQVASKKPSKYKEVEADKNKDIYIIFDFWNTQGITKHKTIDKSKPSINAAIKEYSEDEIKKAIINYNTILNDSAYYWTHKWTLKEFLQRGMDKFRDENEPFNNYKADKKGGSRGENKGARKPAAGKYDHLDK